MGQSHSTSTSLPRPITGARKQKVSRQDSLLETPALWNNGPSGTASNIQSEEIVIPIQELRPAPPPNRRPSYIPAVIFSPHDIRTPTQQTTVSGRRRSLPGIRRAPRLLVAHPPVLHDDDQSDSNQGSDDGNGDTDADLQSTCSSSHTPQDDRPKTPLTDRPPTPWADASDSEPEEPPTSPLSPKQTPSSLSTPPSLIQTTLANTPGIVVKRYFTRYSRCCNALWLDQCYLSTSPPSPHPPTSSFCSSSSHLEDAILPSPAQAICPRCLHRVRSTVHRLRTRTGCFDPETEAASRAASAAAVARRGASAARETIAFKFDLVEAAWVLEQLRRWKAAGEASAAAAAAIQRVCDLRVIGRSECRTGSGFGGGGVLAGGAAGVEVREGEGDVDPGLFLIGDDEEEGEGEDAAAERGGYL
ncbi:hypothetical protein KC332_g4013 [Hortaea werneckii]|nr:hypothetical protein KC358_g3055 [Hortaea werneckii]KAI6851173.1 hypothetical protein KC350_g1730 [Hortaea werneckii]KAI6942063.1 hypothetical protein KC341_g2486 [Hortaea werneckii]KAI6946463.1 hypothetical protein KC348_g3109 [Hortaea werneckii]KAI6965367.1 hypothetical protein KC321_g10142 [Hortaea werneckii]